MLNLLMCGAVLLAAGLPAAAQEKEDEAAAPKAAVNSFYERGPGRDYEVKNVFVGGEVEEPGVVDLSKLPLRSVAVKETAWGPEKPEFKGAFFVTGYALYDILNAKLVKKARADFHPEVDLFVVVENDRGEKAVFSWGEIYYSRNSFNALIGKSARSVTAPKRKKDWDFPAESRLVAADDLYNARFISNPTKITVKSAPGEYPGEKHQAAYAPAFSVVSGGKTMKVDDPAALGEKRSYLYAGYGHGTGFKGLKPAAGWLFKDVLAKAAGPAPQDSAASLVVVSAGDAYRAAFSLSEVINRGDNADFLVSDRGEDEKDGKFSLLAAPDFFVDRNVRSMAKVEIFRQ